MLDPVLLHRFVLIICSKATQALPFRDLLSLFLLLRFLASRSSHSEISTDGQGRVNLVGEDWSVSLFTHAEQNAIQPLPDKEVAPRLDPPALHAVPSTSTVSV